MKKIILISLSLSAILVADEAKGKWQEKMKQIADTFSELLPELALEKSDPKVLEKSAKNLSELAHGLEMGRKSGKLLPPADIDPSVAFLAERFSDTAKHAYLAIHQGKIEYGKGLLNSISTYCIACHTRNDSGPDFPTFPLNVKVEKLNSNERANLYLATRQFDKGLSELESLIDDVNVMKTQPFAWGKYVRQALAVTVRVKKDPDLTEKLIVKALAQSEIPEFERESLLKWKESVENWKKEKTPKIDESHVIREISRLSKVARAAQTTPFDHAGEIEHLRATAAAHDILRLSKDPKMKAEALYIAGTSYEALATPGFYPMHELWYEGCIRELPHGKLALRCYNRLEESIYFGYTGSSGTSIPSDVEASLKRMKALALPIKEKKK